MTVLIVFGDLGKFEVQAGAIIEGEAGDKIFFLDDRLYGVKDGVIARLMISIAGLTCPVFFHGRSRDWHASQRDFLQGAGVTIGLEHPFHHGGDEWREICQLKSQTPTDVSTYLRRWASEIDLQWEDELAAWAALSLIARDFSSAESARKIHTLKTRLCSSHRWKPHAQRLMDAGGKSLLELLEAGPPATPR